MGAFDGTVYRIRARKGDQYSETVWAQDDDDAQDMVANFALHGWDAVNADEVQFVATGTDRLRLSFGDYWNEDSDEDS